MCYKYTLGAGGVRGIDTMLISVLVYATSLVGPKLLVVIKRVSRSYSSKVIGLDGHLSRDFRREVLLVDSPR